MPETTVKGWHCCRCEHDWPARIDVHEQVIKPLRCPRCGSCYWDKPRKLR